MFNFIKKREGIASDTEVQSCCCSETLEVEEKKEEPCCGCSCGDNTITDKNSTCCGK